MKKITWKRLMIALSVLCVFCIISLLTGNFYFFVVALAAFVIILIAPFIK